jgi:hypothetical protein
VSEHQLRQDDGNEFLVLTFLLLVGLMALIYVLTPYYEYYWYYMVKVESWLASSYSFGDLREKTNGVITWLATKQPGNISELERARIENLYLKNLWHRFALYLLLLWMAYKVFAKRNIYTGKPTLESLLKTEHQIWPTLEFVKRFDPVAKFSELKGVGRYQERPVIFSANSKIIDNFVSTVKKSKADRRFNVATANQVFTKQLGRPVTSFLELPPMTKAALTLAVAKDLPDHFTSTNIYGEKVSAFNDVLRLFSIELSKVDIPRKDMDDFLDDLTRPLMQLLDGQVWHLSIGEMAKNNDVKESLKRRFGGTKPEYSELSKLRQFQGTNFLAKSKIKTEYPLIRDLVSAVCTQHVEEAFDFRIDRETTYTAFRSLILKHAYSNTLITRATFLAKRNGKFPAGRLVSFRPWDRDLFFALANPLKYVKDINKIDKQLTFPCEFLGVMSHFYHELLMGSKVTTPFVTRAVRGLHEKLVEQNVLADTKID